MRSIEVGMPVSMTISKGYPSERVVEYTLDDVLEARSKGTSRLWCYEDAQAELVGRVEALLPQEQWEMPSFNIYEALKDRKGQFVEVGGPSLGYALVDFLEVNAQTGKRIQITNLPDKDLIPGVIEQIGDLKLDARVDVRNFPYEDESIGALFSSCFPSGVRQAMIAGATRILEPGGLFIYQGFDTADMAYTLGKGFDLLAYQRSITSFNYYLPLKYGWSAIFQK